MTYIFLNFVLPFVVWVAVGYSAAALVNKLWSGRR